MWHREPKFTSSDTWLFYSPQQGDIISHQNPFLQLMLFNTTPPLRKQFLMIFSRNNPFSSCIYLLGLKSNPHIAPIAKSMNKLYDLKCLIERILLCLDLSATFKMAITAPCGWDFMQILRNVPKKLIMYLLSHSIRIYLQSTETDMQYWQKGVTQED